MVAKDEDPLDLEETEELLEETGSIGDQEVDVIRDNIFLFLGVFCCFGIVLVIGAVVVVLVIPSRKKKSQ
ncbi:MAG: hypothetical protein P1S60_16815 [Anaerolineae bacterium]|nr:hypothetical protein [Anaerolineae bacterium]